MDRRIRARFRSNKPYFSFNSLRNRKLFHLRFEAHFTAFSRAFLRKQRQIPAKSAKIVTCNLTTDYLGFKEFSDISFHHIRLNFMIFRAILTKFNDIAFHFISQGTYISLMKLGV